MSERRKSKMLEYGRHKFQDLMRSSSTRATPSQTPKTETPILKIWEDEATGTTAKLKALLKGIRAPLPTATGDGTELHREKRNTFAGEIKDAIRDLTRTNFRDVPKMVELFRDVSLDNPLNDRDYLMEMIVEAASRMGPGSGQKKVTETFITTLWQDLDHPPQTLLSDEYLFRQPDGSKNSPVNPQIGAAGMPYARTVAPTTKLPGCRPDPAVLFDTLMARKNPGGTNHPNHVSSMLFYLASIIIHDLFKSSHEDQRVSLTSSYLDLAPLYGSNWVEQKKMRTMEDGKIRPDCFAETRLLSFPPGVGALLILFNRYHNYVVEQLASINEGGRFTEHAHHPTVERYGETINKRDDDLFQTGRLITCGLYINIILVDYVRTILNLNETDSNWQLDPRIDIPGGCARGTGNQVSAEFNLVYRWHAAISKKDDLWSQKLFSELDLPPELKDPEEASKPHNIHKFLMALGKMEDQLDALDPQARPWPALKEDRLTRIPDGPFQGNYKDDDLAAILTSGIADYANAMGPQQVPTVMKAVEVLGIQQARRMHCATLNEFRKHFKLTPHETWEDITTNKEVQEALKHLYDTPDEVELYPGLVIEDAKIPKLPGSGLCPSYTVSRGVLSDAVALVRGDRFYTTSYNAASLTNWGFEEASSDPTIDNGCVFYKLFLRALPNNYDPMSVYVHYPLTVPSHMEEILIRLNKQKYYNFDVPRSIAPPKVTFSYAAAQKILNDKETFNVTWGNAIKYLMGPKSTNFMLSGDGPGNAKSRQLMENPMYQGSNSRIITSFSSKDRWLTAVKEYYEDITTDLLKRNTGKLGKMNQVDIVRDVGNLAHVNFAAQLFSFPLKTEKFPSGLFTEQELYLIMAAVFICVFFDLDPPKSFPLRIQAREATQAVGGLIKTQVELIRAGKSIESLLAHLHPTSPPLAAYGVHMLSQLAKSDRDIDDLVWGNIMGTAGGMVANQGQLFSQILDFYLSGDGKQYWSEIHRLALEDTNSADDQLLRYILEGARLNGETGVFRRVSASAPATSGIDIKDDNAVFGARSINVKPGDTIMVNLRAAGRDPTVFIEPDTVRLDRDLETYATFGLGPHQCFGLPMTLIALTTMLKVIGRLENVRPAMVAEGWKTVPSKVKKIVKEFVPGDSAVLPESWHYHLFVMEDWDKYFPFPTSLKINFDGAIPDVKRPTKA